jgi:hypothetical protein
MCIYTYDRHVSDVEVEEMRGFLATHIPSLGKLTYVVIHIQTCQVILVYVYIYIFLFIYISKYIEIGNMPI